MKRRVEDWSVDDLQRKRAQISFPEYQRQPNLWSDEKKGLLIDSILRDIDIPKLYFNQTKDKMYEVVDGQQRLWAIWGYLDDNFIYIRDGGGKKFSQLSKQQRDAITTYPLQVTVLQDADDDYLRELFVRLQLGLLLITGEKLRAATGEMREFVFNKLASHPFMTALGIPERRYAKETLCAQICINSFTRKKNGSFARTRYEDLLFFFKEYEHPQGSDIVLFREQKRKIAAVLDDLATAFGNRAKELRNRSYVLSLYLFFEENRESILATTQERKRFVEFAFLLWRRLKDEASAGMDRTNRELYSFDTLLSSAPGEKYQIERRDVKLNEYFEHYKKARKIKGDQ